MQVVEDQQQRSQLAEQPADRAVHAMALVAARGVAAHRRQHAGEVAILELLRGDVGVQRVDPDAVGPVALELGARAGEDHVAARLSPRAELGEHARLADPRLPLDRHAPAGAQIRVEPRELRAAADDRIQGTGQGASLMSGAG